MPIQTEDAVTEKEFIEQLRDESAFNRLFGNYEKPSQMKTTKRRAELAVVIADE